MSKLSSGKLVLASRVYKMSLENTYGIKAGSIDLFTEYNRYMIIKVLEWNVNDDYLTASQVECLSGIITRPSRNCNC
jgi:hypothetical protein